MKTIILICIGIAALALVSVHGRCCCHGSTSTEASTRCGEDQHTHRRCNKHSSEEHAERPSTKSSEEWSKSTEKSPEEWSKSTEKSPEEWSKSTEKSEEDTDGQQSKATERPWRKSTKRPSHTSTEKKQSKEQHNKDEESGEKALAGATAEGEDARTLTNSEKNEDGTNSKAAASAKEGKAEAGTSSS